MRLGQLARKYDIPLQEIISYLKELEPPNESLHSNSKLSKQTEALVAKRFEISSEMPLPDPKDRTEETSLEKEQDTTVETEVADTEVIEESIETPESKLDLSSTEAEIQDLQKEEQVEDVSIDTDQLLELLESEDKPVILDKITLIKAPKKKLDGLKVVGNIELPEPKAKKSEETGQQEEEPKSERNSKQRRRLVSDEELEERRLKAKKKKEEYEARQERRRKEKDKKQRKASKEAHYQQKMDRIKSNQPKLTPTVEVEPILPEIEEEQRPEPKTLLGKIWRWLNTA